MVALRLLSEKDMYGYEMSQKITAWSGGVVLISEGSLYPTLYRLLNQGYISDRRERVGRRQTRIYYHLEDAGSARLEELCDEFAIFNKGIADILEHKEEDGHG